MNGHETKETIVPIASYIPDCKMPLNESTFCWSELANSHNIYECSLRLWGVLTVGSSCRADETVRYVCVGISLPWTDTMDSN